MIFQAYRADLVSRRAKRESLYNYDRVTRLFTEWLATQNLTPEEAKPGHVQLFLLESEWGPRTRRTALANLRAAYNYAVDMLELVDRNPCKKVRLERPEQKIPRIIPNRRLRELRRQVDTANDLLLHLFIYTGARTVELRRLTWNEVSLADNTLLLRGKRDKERLVPIHPELRMRLVGQAWNGTSPYVVPGRWGGQISHQGVHYRMKQTCGRDIQNHDFRRTVATSLRAQRVDRDVRAAILGWGREEIRVVYEHISVSEMFEAICLLYSDDPI